MVESNNQELDPWSMYLYAMKSPVTRQKYSKRPGLFFNFIGIAVETIGEKIKVFVNLARNEGNTWTFNKILKFM